MSGGHVVLQCECKLSQKMSYSCNCPTTIVFAWIVLPLSPSHPQFLYASATVCSSHLNAICSMDDPKCNMQYARGNMQLEQSQMWYWNIQMWIRAILQVQLCANPPTPPSPTKANLIFFFCQFWPINNSQIKAMFSALALLLSLLVTIPSLSETQGFGSNETQELRSLIETQELGSKTNRNHRLLNPISLVCNRKKNWNLEWQIYIQWASLASLWQTAMLKEKYECKYIQIKLSSLASLWQTEMLNDKYLLRSTSQTLSVPRTMGP